MIIRTVLLLSTFLLAVALRNTPKFYVSFHGGGGKSNIDTVLSYTMQGIQLGSVFSNDANFDELRGMFIDSRTNQLYVANAHDANSMILTFSDCVPGGTRNYVGTFSASGLAHPYGIGQWNTTIFATNQDTNLVTYYDSSGNVLGTFAAQISAPRGIAFDVNGNVYIASEDNSVKVYTSTGVYLMQIAVTVPIGLWYDAPTNLLYISSNSKSHPGVYVWNCASQTLNSTRFHSSSLVHPCGIVVSGDDLYVIGQKSATLVHFSISTGKFIEVLVNFTGDLPEQLIISPC